MKNHVKKNFNTNRKNHIWVSDITFINVGNVYYYLCVIIDLYSRKVITYKLCSKYNTILFIKTLKKAFIKRNKPVHLIFRCDQGPQYTFDNFISLLTDYKIKVSFSNVSDTSDNAVAESLFSRPKVEEINRNYYHNIEYLKKSIMKYIYFYNHKRSTPILITILPMDMKTNDLFILVLNN